MLILLLAFVLSLQEERFPLPSPAAVEQAEKEIEAYGKEEVLSLSYHDLTLFLYDFLWQGTKEPFTACGVNPYFLSLQKAQEPALLLLHGSGSNQGTWIPLLEALSTYPGPIFTYNYSESNAHSALIQKIETIKALYARAGVHTVKIQLIGHSLGAITAVDYTTRPEEWVSGTTIEKVISIAGRLRNIEPPIDTPFYPYCYPVLLRLDALEEQIYKQRGSIPLYTLAAKNDWLVPKESVLMGDDERHEAIVPFCGHALVCRSPLTIKQILQWLAD